MKMKVKERLECFTETSILTKLVVKAYSHLRIFHLSKNILIREIITNYYFDVQFYKDDLQTITPSKMSRQLRGFGISFSTNPHADVDSNGLEDLAIGKIKSFLCF